MDGMAQTHCSIPWEANQHSFGKPLKQHLQGVLEHHKRFVSPYLLIYIFPLYLFSASVSWKRPFPEEGLWGMVPLMLFSRANKRYVAERCHIGWPQTLPVDRQRAPWCWRIVPFLYALDGIAYLLKVELGRLMQPARCAHSAVATAVRSFKGFAAKRLY